jgi:hypothetical protein
MSEIGQAAFDEGVWQLCTAVFSFEFLFLVVICYARQMMSNG